MLFWQQQLQNALSATRSRRPLFLAAGGIALLVIATRWLGVLQTVELAVSDLLFRLRLPEAPEQRILIVEITEPDIQDSGTWPIPDHKLNRLLQTIHRHEPRAIGLDIYRDLPVGSGHQELVKTFQNLEELIAIEKVGNSNSEEIAPPPSLPPEQIGFNNVVADSDGWIRRAVFYSTTDEGLHTSFALRLVLKYLEREDIQPQPSAQNPRWLQLNGYVFKPFTPNAGPYVRTDAQGYQILLNFRDPQQFERVSMGDVLAGKVSPDQIRDRIVLIGSTAESVKDFFFMPYSGRLTEPPEQIAGVELHANIISQILSAALDQRSLLQVWSEPWEWLWIMIWSGLGATVVWRIRNPLRYLATLISLVLLLAGLAYGALVGGWWIPAVPTFLALIASAGSLRAYLAYKEEELKRSTEFLRSVIDNIPDPIFVKDVQYQWIILNQAFCQFTGFPRSQLLGKTDYDVFDPAEAAVFRQAEQTLFSTQVAQEQEEAYTDRFGQKYLSATKRSLHQDAAGNTFLVGVIRDITERKRVEEELRRTTDELTRSNDKLKQTRDRLKELAYSDSLTGLDNRKSFYENFNKMLAWGKNNEKLVGLLYLDLDGFKQVNDSLGHNFGDLLLKAVAGRITNCLRESDLVARLGGDEFTVILPGIKQPNDVSIVAEKIIGTLTQPFMLNDQPVQVTVSIGSSVYPQDGETDTVLINHADQAMYHAKHSGRNQHHQEPLPESGEATL